MTTDEVIGKLSNIKFYLTAGNPIWDSDMIREVMDMAIEALKQNQWVPCSERLPEVGEDVFISVGRDVWEAHLRGAKEYFLTHKTKTLVAEWEVDAWMPLPKAYEGREE